MLSVVHGPQRLQGDSLSVPGLDSPPIRASDCVQISQRESSLAAAPVNHDFRQHVGGARRSDEGRGGGLEAERLSIVFPILVKSGLLLL